MQSSHEYSHFQPPSVGALMDPEYLRDAVRDSTEQRPHAAPTAAAEAHPWLDMVHSLANLFRHQ